MIVFVLFAYVLLAWLRPRIALGVLLFLIPFGHLVRFAIAGVPFTFVEVAVYVLALAVLLRAATSHQPPAASAIGRIRSRLGAGSWQLAARWRDPWIVLPLLWILVAAVSAAYSPNALRAWGIWKAYVLGPVLLFWIIRHVFQRTPVPASVGSGISNDEFLISKQIPNTNDQSFLLLTSYFLLPLTLGALVVAAIAIAQRWWPIGVPYPWNQLGQFRATSVFGYPNAVGLYLAPLIPLFGAATVSLLSLRGARSATEQFHTVQGVGLPRSPAGSLAMTIVFGCGVLLSLLAIILAKSTGALAALGAATPLLAWCWWLTRRHTSKAISRNYTEIHDRGFRCSSRRTMQWAVVVIGVWIAVSLLLTAWLPYRHEQQKWGSPVIQKLTFQKWSGSVRLSQYRETWQLLRDHPIRGAGLAGYQTAIAPYHKDSRVEIFLYPHNLLLAVWSELGLPGLLLFLAMLYQFFRDTLVRCQVSGVRCAITASMLVILIHGLVDVPYFKNDLAMVFWVIVALGTLRFGAGRMESYGERPT